jgi:hypothetical protein
MDNQTTVQSNRAKKHKILLISTAVTILLVALISVLATLYLNRSIELKLVDAYTGKVITNTGVEIYSDNGIRCTMAPCPTDSQDWNGESDSNGLINFPSKTINYSTIILVKGYGSGDLNKDPEKSFDNWTIKLNQDLGN